jgi:hypothetical protein
VCVIHAKKCLTELCNKLGLQAGEDQFQRLLSSMVSKAVASLQLLTNDSAQQQQQQQQAVSLAGQQMLAGNNAAKVIVGAVAAGTVGHASMEPRLLSTPHFLELVGKLGGFKKV